MLTNHHTTASNTTPTTPYVNVEVGAKESELFDQLNTLKEELITGTQEQEK